MTRMRFGLAVENFTPAPRVPDLDAIVAYGRRAEELGYDSLWAWDHMFLGTGRPFPFLESLTTLTVLARETEKVELGTGILVLPLRNPVLLAKEIATLDYLSGGRFLFGIGPGWYPAEFSSTGTDVKERGARTDEILEAVTRLLTADDVTFKGRYYQFENVTIAPRPPKMPEVWVAGGSRVPDPEFSDVPVLAPSVLRRILKADAWISRCSGNQEWVKRDWEEIKGALRAAGRREDEILFSHTNFTYLTEAATREEALARQKPMFDQVMGTHRSFEHLQQSYLLGTIDEIIERLKDLESAGMEYVVLGPTSDDLGQLDLIAKHLLPAFD